jgi:hypothetical protein
MKAQAYYWLHVLPVLIAMGLALALMITSVVLSIPARSRATWLPRLYTGLFGGLLFMSPPFRALVHPLPVGQMSWMRLDEAAALFLHEHVHFEGATSAWLPEFLVGFLVFVLVRMLVGWLRR